MTTLTIGQRMFGIQSFEQAYSSVCSDCSYQSKLNEEHKSFNFNLSNGAPINVTNFNIVHYNMNSILANDKLYDIWLGLAKGLNSEHPLPNSNYCSNLGFTTGQLQNNYKQTEIFQIPC